MSIRQCIECDKVKPSDAFYVSSDGKYSSRCKPCHVAKTATYTNSQPPSHETAVVRWLRNRGIPSIHGKHIKLPRFNFVDVVCFGCIEVEVKNCATERDAITFTDRQQKDFTAPIILVVTPRSTYHVFLSNDPIFFTTSGSTRRRYVPLSPADLTRSLNRFDYIERAFRQYCIMLGEPHDI